MTQEDAQLLYDWLIATYGDPTTAKAVDNQRRDNQAGRNDNHGVLNHENRHDGSRDD